jgi:hypothetical protein
MTQEQAQVAEKLANIRRIDIKNLISYPEYYTLKEEIEKCVMRLKDIDNLDFESNVSIEVQAQAAILAKKTFLQLLADLQAYAYKETNKTNSYN